ncbi:MAG: hemolysin family protein [Bacteroidota bacterium]
MSTQLLVIVLSVISTAFFCGLEIAFLTSNKLRIELENKQGNLNAKILSYFIKHQSYYIGATLVGIAGSIVVFSLYMSDLMQPHLERITHNKVLILLMDTFISTLIILVIAEYLPKNIFRSYPNALLSFFAIPLLVVYFILFPIVFVSIKLSDFFLRFVFRVRQTQEPVVFGRVDLDNLVRESTSRMSEEEELQHEVQIFQNALDFSEVKVRECMVPRTEIVAVSVNSSIEQLRQKFIDTRLSKILVYENSIDNMIGYTHSYELFKKPDSIRSILRPSLIVPETMPASGALTLFIQQHKSVAVVVDEFGGTAGMLTMEDVMEEIFGEIEDEHDKEDLVEKQITDNEYVFSGRLEIDYLNETYGLDLPLVEGFETLAGFILNNYKSLPRRGETIRIGKYVFKILAVSDTRIEQVSIRVEE